MERQSSSPELPAELKTQLGIALAKASSKLPEAERDSVTDAIIRRATHAISESRNIISNHLDHANR